MRWPWQRARSTDRLVLSWCAQTLTYVKARALTDGSFQVTACGVEHQGTDNLETFAQRLQGLGLKGMDATIMLRAEQYQLLQIDTPNVPTEEMRAAARYQVREMLQTHVDDVTIDIMLVGDGQQKGSSHSFVVAASNALVAEVMAVAQALDCTVSVIDIQETAQRNLQSALAQRDGVLERATAALILLEGQQAVLTISANEELFYTRRFEIPEGFLTSTWGQAVTAQAPIDGFTPVQEYMPDYASGDISLDSDFAVSSSPIVSTPVRVPTNTPDTRQLDDERAQRLVLEIQRSLDVWDRTWSVLPLSRLRVFAGERSAELATWLAQQLGQTVTALEVSPIYAGLESIAAADLTMGFPLLGVLLRTEAQSQ
jgi:MSHA biogenesis protein MshI